MRVNHIFSLLVFIVAAALQLSSCASGSDEENITNILNDNRSNINEPYTADSVIIGDTTRVFVEIDTDDASLTEALNTINGSCKRILEKAREKKRKNDSIDIRRYDFSINSSNCIFSLSYSYYTAVEVAGYFFDKGDKTDRVIVCDFHDRAKSSLSSIVISGSRYHDIMALFEKDYEKDEIRGMYASMVKAENSLRIKGLTLPQQTDGFTYLRNIVINEGSYDFYFTISSEVSGMLDENAMKQIGNNVSASVSEVFDNMNGADKIKSDLEILNKRVVYHYAVKRHDDEGFRLIFKFPKLNSFILEKE